ncbi:unnamed protein product [Owenia fusiformis]|uniref:Uncharacterized protein n=1 Tax=Owenia fusiformis TaxID=6347 RepID=A0A8J1TEM1_OWEFU|nr:unnamed protein product [Owenia fusiformis]
MHVLRNRNLQCHFLIGLSNFIGPACTTGDIYATIQEQWPSPAISKSYQTSHTRQTYQDQPITTPAAYQDQPITVPATYQDQTITAHSTSMMLQNANQLYDTIDAVPPPFEVSDNYTCSLCYKNMFSKRCLEYHNQLVHNKYCDVCNRRLDQLGDDPTNHGAAHTGEKSHQCRDCYKLFQSNRGLQHHLAKDLQCAVCSKIVIETNKVTHMRSHVEMFQKK